MNEPPCEQPTATYDPANAALQEAVTAPDPNLTTPESPSEQAKRETEQNPAYSAVSKPRLIGRYEELGKVGEGGMGFVLKARDPALNRELAIKVMLTAHRDRGDLRQRFLGEAQVGGQLQHPGLVPVYEVGQFPDGCDYFTMKLVQGETLATLLKQRASPTDELPRFLQIFEQTCQTLAYAHSRGVIHRDLKPLNVMVGAFGEVQVMDWGLAKVLGRTESPSQQGNDTANVVRTVRTEQGDDTGSGRGMGTPGFMPPEQARGEISRIDERADVFGLGAILCVILTGRPPYDLAYAFARLDDCGADAELIGLARRCLAAEPEARPRHAGEMAVQVTAYRAGVQERLKAAEIERAAADARAEEAQARAVAEGRARQEAQAREEEAHRRATAERRARRMTVGLATAAVLVVGAAGWLWQARVAAQAEQTRLVDADLNEMAERRQKGEWDLAWQALERAEGRLTGSDDQPLRRRVDQARAELAQQRSDQKMLASLEEARLQLAAAVPNQDQGFDRTGADRRYGRVFADYKLDLENLTVEEAGARVAASAICEQLVAGLDDWVYVTDVTDGQRAERLRSIADRADRSEWRRQLRRAIAARDQAALKRFAAEPGSAGLPSSTVLLLARGLVSVEEEEQARALLREGWRRRPGDFWLCFELSRAVLVTSGEKGAEEAVRYLTAALALQPDSAVVHNNLGGALLYQGKLLDAVAQYREALRLQPKLPEAHRGLGNVLRAQKKFPEAVAAYREAIQIQPDDPRGHYGVGNALCDQRMLPEAVAAYEAALRLDPNDPLAHGGLGNALSAQQKWPEALAAYREALRCQPNFPEAHLGLGNALHAQGKLPEAAGALRAAIGLKPDYFEAHHNLGTTLFAQGKLPEAETAYRQAIRLKPDAPESHSGLASVLHAQGKLPEAVAAFREATRLEPNDPLPHYNLGVALRDQGKLPEAVAAYGEALRLKPDYPEAHLNLGVALYAQGKWPEAVAAYREGLRLKPHDPLGHFNLGAALRAQGKSPEAEAAFREALRIQPDYPRAHLGLGNVLHKQGKLPEAEAACREAIRLQPDFPQAHYSLGLVLYHRQKWSAAESAYREALRLQPDYPEAHTNLGLTLHAQGKLPEAVVAYREALRIQPDHTFANYNLGIALAAQQKWPEAVAAYQKAIQTRRDFAEPHCNLGFVLRTQGQFAESLASFQRGHELGSRTPGWSYPSGQWLREAERLAALEAKLPAVRNGTARPTDAAERLGLIQVCRAKRLTAAAAALSAPLADDLASADPSRGLRYNAACAAALAGCGQGADDPKPNDSDRQRLRQQALGWLDADLAAWSRFTADGNPRDRAEVVQTLRHWRQDSDLVGIRHPWSLLRLPEGERKQWRQLWQDVDALRQRAQDVK